MAEQLTGARRGGTNRRFWKSLRRRPTAIASFLLIFAFVVMAIAPSAFTAASPTAHNLRARHMPPAWMEGGTSEHLLGTDHLGRDVFARVVNGARVSLLVALASFLGAGLLGVVIGLVAGFFGGRIDDFLTFVMNVQLGFPFLLIAMVLLVFIRPSLSSIILVLTITTWVMYARVVRGVVLSVREYQYVEASRAIGAKAIRLLLKHVLPNIAAPVLVIGTLEMSRVVILEASLSFLGLGIPPSTPTWGGMLSEGRQHMLISPWLTSVPGFAILLLVLSINLIGDFLRDFFDPRLQQT